MTSQDSTAEAILERFEALNTAVICDVFDEKRWKAPALDMGVKPFTTSGGTVAGWAYTIEGSCLNEAGPDREKLRVVDATPSGSIAVWSGTDAQGFCLFGDLLALTMASRGCRGAIVDGGFRDRATIQSQGFPVFARYTSPVQAVGRWRVTGANVTLRLTSATREELTVSPGDLVLADDDGVVVVPRHDVGEVLARAEQIVRDEETARKPDGTPFSAVEMLERFGHV